MASECFVPLAKTTAVISPNTGKEAIIIEHQHALHVHTHAHTHMCTKAQTHTAYVPTIDVEDLISLQSAELSVGRGQLYRPIMPIPTHGTD